MKNKYPLLIAISIAIILVTILVFLGYTLIHIFNPPVVGSFDGDRAFRDVVTQVNFGPRIPDSKAHQETIQYIQTQLDKAGWKSQVLEQPINNHTAYNVLATRSNDQPAILIGAHYDSRLRADNDPNPSNQNSPVPGANDGASGVAVMLEMARTLPKDSISVGLLFIDIEDNGNLPGWDWIQGSTAFAANMPFKPKAVVILDMIGDKNLGIYMEKSSDKMLTNQIWSSAKNLGFQAAFIPSYKYQVIDDQSPFIEKGIPSVDIIDLDYPYWHTLQDIPANVSADSLQMVGATMLAWLKEFGPCIQAGNCNAK